MHLIGTSVRKCSRYPTSKECLSHSHNCHFHPGMSFLYHCNQTQAQKRDLSALAFESSIISELLGSELLKCTIILLNVFLRCYEIQFPGWNVRSQKNPDTQSGVKASFRSAETLSFASPLHEHANITAFYPSAVKSITTYFSF